MSTSTSDPYVKVSTTFLSPSSTSWFEQVDGMQTAKLMVEKRAMEWPDWRKNSKLADLPKTVTTYIIESAFVSLVGLKLFPQKVGVLQGFWDFWLQPCEAIFASETVTSGFNAQALIKITKVVDISVEQTRRELCRGVMHLREKNWRRSILRYAIHTHSSMPKTQIPAELLHIYENRHGTLLRRPKRLIGRKVVEVARNFESKRWWNLWMRKTNWNTAQNNNRDFYLFHSTIFQVQRIVKFLQLWLHHSVEALHLAASHSENNFHHKLVRILSTLR